MKRVLGLDLGSTSIGWAVVEENSREITNEADTSENDKIVAIGSRIIPLSTDEGTQFSARTQICLPYLESSLTPFN